MNQVLSDVDVSIVMCCHNSVKRAPLAVEHLSKSKLQGIRAELVVVDNGSSDGTGEVIREAWSKLRNPFPLRIVSEVRLGLSWARERGVREAAGEIIVFCDDDNLLDPDYLVVAHRFLAGNKTIGALGGRSEPLFEGGSEAPYWFWSHGDSFALGAQGLKSGLANQRGYLWGAGLAVRRRVLLALYEAGVTPVLSGRASGRLLSGDDSEICKWILLAGLDLFFLDALRFRHFVPLERQRQEYLEGLFAGFSAASGLLSIYSLFIRQQRGAGSLAPLLLCGVRLFRMRMSHRKAYHAVQDNVRIITRSAAALRP